MLSRILAILALLFSILFLPLWVSVILALGAMIYFSFFLEAVFLFLLSDFLYAVPEERYYGTVFTSFIVSFLVLLLIEGVKKKVRMHPKKNNDY